MIFKRTLATVLASVFLMAASPAISQKMIRLDGDKCASGLRMLASLIDATITPASPPRQFAGKCQASGVVVSDISNDIELRFKQLRWNSGGLTPLIEELLPVQLDIDIKGITLQNAPKNDPVWGFIRQQVSAARSVDSEIRWSFQAGERKLDLNSLMLDFGNGNRLTAAIKLINVSPKLLSQPEVFGLAIAASDATVSIEGNRRFGDGIVQAILASVPATDLPIEGMSELRSRLRQAARDNYQGLLDSASWGKLGQMIDDIPHPSGLVSLQFQSETGILLLRLAAVKTSIGVKKLLDGAHVNFDYSPVGSG
ncbi:MAG: hypothetical protein V3V25_00630 [Paracoccaceae bacterium]